MNIRPATEADIAALFALERVSPTAAHWSREQYQAMFSGQELSRTILVIEDDDFVRGFLGGLAVHQEWEIENLVVDPTARRRGLGARLLKAFVDMARQRGADAIFLEVRESNTAARRLYEKCSFRQTGTRKRYYQSPEEDAVLLRLDLR